MRPPKADQAKKRGEKRYTSDEWANDWSDYIYDQQEYATLDGGSIKASTAYDAVFQNGDEFYFGLVGNAPESWTQLAPN